MKKISVITLVFAVVFCFSGILFAAETSGAEGQTAQATGKATNNSVQFFAFTVLAAALGVGIAAFGCGIAQGMATAKAAEGLSRQPEAGGAIQTMLIIGLAFIESLTIYALVIGLILIFANPYVNLFIG
ncbi:MAG: ATP synthase F0 subunit C [Candidatus Goldbacteria bacterium]|nr:ATP synthase F0 subunit C [Candidatus Goldiibacteriota bacterium]HPD19048.1 ATP synthase F0 subunit C [Candidatus Goldiibacteriota bacterium]